MKERMKKRFAVILAVLMVLTALPGMAFAETEQTPNFSGEVFLDNLDCKEYESYEQLAALPLTLTIASETDAAQTVSFKLEVDAIGDYAVEAYDDSPEMAAIMETIFINQEAVFDAWMAGEMTDEAYYAAVFAGYTVTLNLGEDSHWTAELFDGGVTTNKDIIYEFDLAIDLIVEIYNAMAEEFGEEPIVMTEENRPKTFEEFALFVVNLNGEVQYDSYEAVLRDPASGYTEEEIQELLAEMRAQDEALAAARAENETYPTSLYILMSLHCDCPYLVDYEVYHQYLVEKNGKLVEVGVIDECEFLGEDTYYLRGEEGTVVRSKDYVREVYDGWNEDYAGKTFTYVGSYDSWSDWYDLDADLSADTLEEYTLSEDSDYDGFVLRYVLKEEAPKKDADKDAKPEKNTDTEDGTAAGESAPLTGDGMPVGMYTMLLVTALAALAAMLGLKKRA